MRVLWRICAGNEGSRGARVPEALPWECDAVSDSKEWLTAAELAERLRVKPGTVKGWARESRIPCIRVNAKVIRFDLESVVAAIADGRAGQEGGGQ